MLPAAQHLEIHEQQDDGSLRLQLTGDLDLASAHVLEQRLKQLHTEQQPVRLDLSKLEFMDSTGIHLLISQFKQARADGWHFAVEPDLSSQVERLLKLTSVYPFTGPGAEPFARL